MSEKWQCDNCKCLDNYVGDFRDTEKQRIIFEHTRGFKPLTDAFYLHYEFCSIKCFKEWWNNYDQKEVE